MIKKIKLIYNFNYVRLKFKTFWNDLSFLFYNFQRKYLKLFKFFDQRKIGSIPRILISSMIIVSFFYFAPFIANYKNNNLFNAKEY